MALCPFCSQSVPTGASACPSCGHALASGEEDVYDLDASVPSGEQEIPTEWRGGALYTLEQPARCPFCRAPIRTVRVVRLSRSQVAFTSTLPRGGRAMVCPECDRILSMELATLG